MGTPSDIHGISVRAWRHFSPGDLIGKLAGEELDQPTVRSVQVGIDRHLELSDPGPGEVAFRHLNHSCEPNVALDATERVVRAIAPIGEGEELTFDYLTTEWRMAQPFECRCGAAHCRRWIAGFAEVEDPARAELWDQVAPHLRELAVGAGMESPR
jgi:hypothetical protein